MKSKSPIFWLISFWLAASASGASRPERLLLRFYAKHEPQIQSAYLSEVVRDTEKWLKRAALLPQEETFLCMGHRESEFNMFDDDKNLIKHKRDHSTGIYQTQEKLRPGLRAWWKERGYTFGPDDSLDAQCAFGVAEFRQKLNAFRGSVWLGVRHYNGGGTGAMAYARNVFISRRVIFGHPHVGGEAVKVDYITGRKR